MPASRETPAHHVKGFRGTQAEQRKNYLTELFNEKLWKLQMTYDCATMLKYSGNQKTIRATMKYHVLLIKFAKFKK